MPVIRWSDSFSVGVQEIDAEHKKLLEIINALVLERRVGGSKKGYFATLNALIHYAEQHFRTEEGHMREHAYPSLETHEQAHQAFVERVFELNQSLEAKGGQVYHELVDFVRDGYKSHVLGMDKEYGSYLKKLEAR